MWMHRSHKSIKPTTHELFSVFHELLLTKPQTGKLTFLCESRHFYHHWCVSKDLATLTFNRFTLHYTSSFGTQRTTANTKINRKHFVLQMGVIRGTYLALEHMNKLTGGRGGVIVNTASMAGKAHDGMHVGYIIQQK